MAIKRIKPVLKAAAFLLAAVFILFCFAACGKNNETVSVHSYAKDAVKDVFPANPETKFHVSNPDISKLKFIAKSGLVEIYIDDSTYSVVVYETLKKEYWYSLPVIPAGGSTGYDNSAAPVTLTLVNGSDTFYLNSQDNAVAYGNGSYEKFSDAKGREGVKVNYIITPDKETAEKDKFDETDISFLVSLEYILEDGSLYVTCQNKNLSGNKDIVIKDIGMLEFFGASSSALPGDFLLVPDGSGALIYTAVEQPDFSKLTFSVYGSNQNTDSADEKPAVVAAYGIKKGENALAVLIEKGDAIAKITADRVSGNSGFNKVGSLFNITEVKDIEKNNKIYRYTGNNAFAGELKLCLRFLSGGNATYSGMAAVCREQLIRDDILSTKTVEKGDYLPFNLTVAGAINKNIINGIPVKLTSKLTTFDQTQDMITRMKSKGINSIFLRYTGILSGGLNQKDISDSNIMLSLGGKKGFAELNTYMKTQKMELYLDINLLTSRKPLITDESKTITTVTDEKGFTETKNDYYGYIGDESFDQTLRPVFGLENAILKTLTRFKDSALNGFCLNDAGRVLYSDYSKNSFNRQKAADTIAEKITSLSTGRKLMADTGNFYAIKKVDVLVNMPIPSGAEAEGVVPYRYIPFVQLILHGVMDYSGMPVNKAFDQNDTVTKASDIVFGNLSDQKQKAFVDSMLRSIEYGACPSYEWSYKQLDKEAVGLETFYYDDWINQAVEYYLKANAALSDLRSSRMVKHTQIQPGVFCTEYEGSKLIYVNYNYEAVDIGGITVQARNFIRL